MKNIEALIDDGGEITLGALPPHECAATAADGSNALAMLEAETAKRSTRCSGGWIEPSVRTTPTVKPSTRSTALDLGQVGKMGRLAAYGVP